MHWGIFCVKVNWAFTYCGVCYLFLWCLIFCPPCFHFSAVLFEPFGLFVNVLSLIKHFIDNLLDTTPGQMLRKPTGITNNST